MICINAKIVDFTNKDPNYQFKKEVLDYHKTIDDLKDRHDEDVEFQTRAAKVRLDPITKLPLPPKAFAFPFKNKISTDDGTQDWVYSESAPNIKDGVATPNESHFHIPRGSKGISLIDDPDLIYYLTKSVAYPKQLWIFDPDKEASDLANDRSRSNRLNDVIYSPNSPLSQDPEKLKLIAAKWGITVTARSSVDSLKNNLYAAVTEDEKNRRKHVASARGIDGFLSDLGSGDALKVGANIQTAMDDGSLVFDRTTGQWHLYINQSEKPLIIMNAGAVGGDIARAKLQDYLSKNRDDAMLIEQVAKGEAKVERGQIVEKEPEEVIIIPTDVTLENVTKKKFGKYVVDFATIRKAAKQLGIKGGVGISHEDYANKVKEKLEQLAQTV